MSSAAFVGIDPGGKETGIVVRYCSDVLDHAVVAGGPVAVTDWLLTHTERNVWAAERWGRHTSERTVPYKPYHHTNVVFAVEGLNTPNPHMGMTNVRGLIDAAMVLGAVVAFFPKAIVVPPGGNGSGPLTAYPEALRPTRGKGAGKDRLRHCRSAWDVSLAAERMLRVGAA